jgi:hypothetical protein
MTPPSSTTPSLGRPTAHAKSSSTLPTLPIPTLRPPATPSARPAERPLDQRAQDRGGHSTNSCPICSLSLTGSQAGWPRPGSYAPASRIHQQAGGGSPRLLSASRP